jgi:SAM-dependent methyltransferase
VRLVAPLEGHALWSATYDTEPNPIVALETRIVAPLLGPLERKRFLDIGCGTGRWLEPARARGAVAVGIDRSPEMLARARVKGGLGGRVACADALVLPCRDGAADVLVCAFCLSYVEPLDALLRELGRAAKRGAEVWTSDLHPLAAARGWSRAFRLGEARYAIATHPYTLAQLDAAAEGARLDLQERLEPRFGGPERAIFRRAGKESLFESAAAEPAIVISRWRRR